MKNWTLFAAFAAFAALACAPGNAQQPAAAPAPGGPGVTGTLLVGNKGENTLSFIDLASGRELGRAETGRMPHEIAVSPSGTQAAVVAYGARAIDIFDIASRRRLRTIDLSPNDGPHGLVWLPDGQILATTERSQSLTIVHTLLEDRVSAIPTGQQGTHMVAIRPGERRAYTANIGSGTVSVLDIDSVGKLRDLAVGGRPEGIAVSPDGGVLWVADLDGARVQAFNTLTYERMAEVPTGPVPIRVAISPDGHWVVTSNNGDGTLTVIDTHNRVSPRTIIVSGEQSAVQVTILFSPDGRRIYAAETGRNMVAEIDFESGRVLRRLAAGANGDGLAIAE